MHAEFMAFATDETAQAALRGWAERQGFPAVCVQAGGAEAFSAMLEHAAPPKLAMVDIDQVEDPAACITRLHSLVDGACRLIAIGSANDVTLYRKILGAGAVDYLVKPLTADVIGQAYASASHGGIAGKSEAREARVVLVVGVRGGVGATTLAVNTGWLLAHEFRLPSALLDLDLQYGTSSLALDLEPGRGLRDVLSSPQRVDSLMVASSMVAASDRFSVLGAEESLEDQVPVDAGAIVALLGEMKGNFDFIIVDLPRHMLAAQKRLLSAAHEIVLVTEMSLAGIRDTLRLKNALKSMGIAANTTVIGARTGASQAGQVDRAAFEKGTQVKIDILVPEDVKSVTEAANTGKPLGATAKDAPVTKALRSLAARLSGKTPAESKTQSPFDQLRGLIKPLTKKTKDAKGAAPKEKL